MLSQFASDFSGSMNLHLENKRATAMPTIFLVFERKRTC